MNVAGLKIIAVTIVPRHRPPGENNTGWPAAAIDAGNEVNPLIRRKAAYLHDESEQA